MMKPVERLDIDRDELEALLERTREGALSEEDYTTLKRVVETLGYLTELLEDRKTTIQRLREILFGPSTEKTRNVLKPEPRAGEAPTGGGDSSGGAKTDEGGRGEAEGETKRKAAGHGRNGGGAYSGAARVRVHHPTLKSGDGCPDCRKGKVYASVTPGILVRVVGQAPIGATVYEVEKLRCNLCQMVFTAPAPEGVGENKYDESSGSMIALLKYGMGTPFYRLARMQLSLGIPLPASTQWEIVHQVAGVVEPAYRELIRQSAQGEVLHNDDTTIKILSLKTDRQQGREPPPDSADAPSRTGVFTSGIVSTREGRRIALFFTGHKHAGENLADVLAQRESELGPPIQMCDALSRNLPAKFEVVLANCTAHGRRKFVEVARNFPAECRYVLETLAEVYKNDAVAKDQGMTSEQRLAFHQTHSAPLMKELENWFTQQFEEHTVEPNSGLGRAISYMKNHWLKLTRFLHVAGAPLDNNICERALKKVILHRKNALFFKTVTGAHVADVFMSLIHTCELSGVDPFLYLTQLQRHRERVSLNPQDWMPWNFEESAGLIPASR